jgi:selenocysteine lyase/cysteine desulfurase
MESYKKYFSKALGADDARLHFAAHSHHLWPDCTQAAHSQAWLDAATLADDKWDRIFGELIPTAQAHIARQLSLPDPTTICFAPNTHEFLLRLHSSLPVSPSVLTTNAEFHSFTRQRKRWEEEGKTEFEVVAAEPFESFGARFLKSAARYEHDMIYISQVFFNSGYVVEFLDELVEIVRGRDTLVVIDGYHAFMALPVSLEAIHDRVFYIAGGYKYAMSGEGVCFMHCPPGFAMRPVNTGWFAGFDGLGGSVEQVSYSTDGMRFAGATFDPSGLHRFNAVQELFQSLDLSVLALHERIQILQNRFLDGLVERRVALGEFIPGAGGNELGHFLTFKSRHAESICNSLARQNVMCDFREDRLRLGFAMYHDPSDIEDLLNRLAEVSPQATPIPPQESVLDTALDSALAAEARATGPIDAVAPPMGTGSDSDSDSGSGSGSGSGSDSGSDSGSGSGTGSGSDSDSGTGGSGTGSDSDESEGNDAARMFGTSDSASDSDGESDESEDKEPAAMFDTSDAASEAEADAAADSTSNGASSAAALAEAAAAAKTTSKKKKRKKKQRKSKS